MAEAPEYKKYMCLICGYIYDEEHGLPEAGLPPGTRWEDVPLSWRCPDCGAGREDFELDEQRLAGPTDWTIVLKKRGADNGNPADIRLTQQLRDGGISIATHVRAVGGEDWRLRNEMRLTRAKPDAEALVRAWRVDLRPTPDADAYFQPFRVDSVADGVITGSFYGTPIENGRIDMNWGVVHFAFTTQDGSGVYHTSGVLRDGRLQGTTHSLGRGFLNVWTAEPAAQR